jgi:D-sedoheptulose 7-phosphate isomerase
MQTYIKQLIEDSIRIKNDIISNPELIKNIDNVVNKIIQCLKNNGKVLFCGNGGSAADAQHLAAELSGRFYLDRDPLFAEALHVNTSYLTSVSNDYGYDEVYSRLVKGMGRKGDILIGLSTSGNSKNIIKAFNMANEIGMHTVAMTDASGGELKNICKYLINVPSENTPRIQESHILIGHIICEIVEDKIFNLSKDLKK